MIQNIIAFIIVLLAAVYLFKKFAPRRKKALPSHISSSKSSNCGCGASCPVRKK